MLSRRWVSCSCHCIPYGNAYSSVTGAHAEDSDRGTLPTILRNKKAVVEFDRDENDAPVLVDPSGMMARVMEPVVRQFLSIHYSESIRWVIRITDLTFFHVGNIANGKRAVDWTAISENQNDMINPKYLPPNFVFRDPSKMKKAHYQALLDHWYSRQEDEMTSTVFAFKGYWDPASGSVVTAHLKQPTRKHKTVPGKVGETKKRTGPPGIRLGDKGWTGGEDEEGTGDEEEDEDMGDEKDEDDNGEGGDDDHNNHRQHRTRSRVPPMDLPFSAKRVAPRVAPMKTRSKHQLPAVVQRKVGAGLPDNNEFPALQPRDAGSSKSKNTDHGSQGLIMKQRPQPRPRRGLPSDSRSISNGPQPVVEKTARKTKSAIPPPQFERPDTRNARKRKVDSELQAVGHSSNKKAKRDTADKGSRRNKAKSRK
jgi:hypothetical protein